MESDLSNVTSATFPKSLSVMGNLLKTFQELHKNDCQYKKHH